MAPLIILLSVFAVLRLIDRFLLGGKIGLSFAGRAAMSLMLLATGISHFTNPEPMVAMMPGSMPAKLELVYFTGACELLAVAGLLWNKTARLTAIMLIIFFIAVLPANIVGSLKAVEFGGMQYGPWYLLFRIPLQFFFIWWVWYFGIRRLTNSPSLR
ncbi:MAG TPA: DoxX family protein [Pyrinomonadaceae bacterium]|nr:DoxX family protein [Pyrinomonadaceae bacterium]